MVPLFVKQLNYRYRVKRWKCKYLYGVFFGCIYSHERNERQANVRIYIKIPYATFLPSQF